MCPRLSIAVMVSVVLPPEATVTGEADAVTVTLLATEVTVNPTFAVPVTHGYCHSSTALAVKLILSGTPVLFAGAV